jgi:hypothetical protein
VNYWLLNAVLWVLVGHLPIEKPAPAAVRAYVWWLYGLVTWGVLLLVLGA